jgi:hypothetical protein
MRASRSGIARFAILINEKHRGRCRPEKRSGLEW